MKGTIGIGRKLITFLSVFSILVVSVFSVFIGVDFTTVAETPANIEYWGGYDSAKVAIEFSDGDGSSVNPYIITNGDQLFRMVYDFGKSANNEATYYKLANDIYLNDITDYDKWGTYGFDMTTLNNWYENDLILIILLNSQAILTATGIIFTVVCTRISLCSIFARSSRRRKH